MSWFLFHNLTLATWPYTACPLWSYLRSKLQTSALQLHIHTDVSNEDWRSDFPSYESNGLKHTTAWVNVRALNLLGNRNACFQNTLSVLYSGFPKERKKTSHSSIQWTVFEIGVLVCSSQLSAPNKHTPHCRTQLEFRRTQWRQRFALGWLTPSVCASNSFLLCADSQGSFEMMFPAMLFCSV